MSRGLLRHPPRQGELERLYFELSRRGASTVGRKRPWPYKQHTPESLLALAAEMLRYDARLLTVLLQLVLGAWQELNPLELRRQMAEMRWPQALLVVTQFALLARADRELGHFVEYLSAGWFRVEPGERFFIDGDRPASRTAQRRLGRNLKPYARWGFWGTERPIADPATRRTVGCYDPHTRRHILDQLSERRGSFALTDYLHALDYSISRQQALADLKRHDRIELVGHGRGAHWRVSSQ